MTIELSIILILVALLIAQQCFYMWQVHTLVNKLMSRDFAEYKIVSSPPKPRDRGIPVNIGELDNTVDINTLI